MSRQRLFLSSIDQGALQRLPAQHSEKVLLVQHRPGAEADRSESVPPHPGRASARGESPEICCIT